jgi:ABC-type thiamine transport system ATPase subunit
MDPDDAGKSTLFEIIAGCLHPLPPPDLLLNVTPSPMLTYTVSSATQHNILFLQLNMHKMLPSADASTSVDASRPRA